MKIANPGFILFCSVVSFTLFLFIACHDSTDANPVTTAGSGGTAPGQGGSGGAAEAGIGGANQGGKAGSGGVAGNPYWPAGKGLGNVTGKTALAANAGIIRTLGVQQSLAKPMNLPFEDSGVGGDGGEGGSAGTGNVNTVPQVDTSKIQGTTWIPTPIYGSLDLHTFYPPMTVIAKPNLPQVVVQHFTTEEAIEEFSIMRPDKSYPVWDSFLTSVNGTDLEGQAGMDFSLVPCAVAGETHYFFTSIGADKIFDLKEDGTKTTLVSGLVGPSQILCHPDGYLLVSILPTWEFLPEEDGATGEKGPLKTKPRVLKISFDGTIQQYAELPGEIRMDETQIFMTRWLKSTSDLVPQGLRYPMALRPDMSLLISDPVATSMYMIDATGTSVTWIADTSYLMITAIGAPNGNIYAITSLVLKDDLYSIYANPKIQGLDGSTWVTLQELSGYEPFIASNKLGTMFNVGLFCPGQEHDGGKCQDTNSCCLYPVGMFEFITSDDYGNLVVSSPVKGTVDSYHLAFPDNTGGSGGESGSGGSEQGGAAGEAGSAGSTP